MKIRGKILFLAGAVTALGAGWAGFPHLIYKSRLQPVDFSHKVHAETAGDFHPVRVVFSFHGLPPFSS